MLLLRSTRLTILPFLLMPLAGAAQQVRQDRAGPEVTIISADGAGPDFDTRTLRHGFDLFAAADGAFSGMRATGQYGSSINNYGPCDGTFRNCQNSRVYLPQLGQWAPPFFEVQYYVGAPPSQYVKIKAVAPSIANATGGGWTANHTRRVVGTNTTFGPADGSLGRLFSGVTSTADGSCRDHQYYPNGWYTAGYQLLATSDCPETWGGEGWQGAHPIDAAGWQSQFARQGDAFDWGYWRVPSENQRLDRPFLGTRHHTYGETTDYNTQALAGFGSAVPGGVGVPQVQGYPLGLFLRFDAFNFADPRVQDAYFVQVTIVNRSADVWGTGIDYDSLYFGLAQGTLFFGGDVSSRYGVPDRGMVIYHKSNVQGAGGPCDDPGRLAGGGGCQASTSIYRGYGSGVVSQVFLKTPLGDLRNKLFTRTARGEPCVEGQDPFCRPSHPFAGDSITFNQQSFGDYGGAFQFTWGAGARASFGFIAGDEVNTLAGRDPGGATDRQLWTTFRSEDWATNKVHYNKYVPPASPPWDYNHDGIPDTLAISTCGRYGCAVVDSDTMPGGWLNRRGNIGGIQGFGPFSLKAGDTTAVVYAMVGSGDSARFWAQIDAVIDEYLTFFLTPEAPPRAEVVSTRVTPGTTAGRTATPALAFAFSDAPETWVDPYLAKLATDVATDPSYADLLARNPWLPDSLNARARDNLARLEIYKSCDGGATWTGDADCTGDRTSDVDHATLGEGWQAYALFDADPKTGNVPSAFTDANVVAGRTYLYTIVGRSRGATFAIDSAGGPVIHTFAPALWNPLSRRPADPNVVSVYVPVSRPAGFAAARVAFASGPTATVPFTVQLTDEVTAASYRAVFGNEIVVERDSNTTTGMLEQSVVVVRRRELVDVGGVGVDSVIRAESFVYASPQPFLVEGAGVEGPPTIAGDLVRIPTTYAGLGFVLVRTSGAQEPVFGSTTLTAGAATPSGLLGRAEYGGFTIDADNTLAGAYDAVAESQYRGAQSRAELQLLPSDTIVPRDIVDRFMVQWRVPSAIRTGDGGGAYVVRWVDDPFGVARGFVLNFTNPAATEAEVQAALAARAVGAIGRTDPATAALMGVPQTDLVAVQVPFTIENTTFGRAVDLAMLRRPSNRRVLGQGNDTVSVAIPTDVWVPGDWLYLLEELVEDSTIGGRLVLAGGTPVQRTRRAVAFTRAVLGCNQVRESCNPVIFTTRGGSGYSPMRSGDETRFAYYVGFTPTTEYLFDVIPAVTGAQITAVTDSALGLIRVVPNPFLLYSAYQSSVGEARLVFTHLPPTGTLRVYTVAAQLVQQISWVPSDLAGDGDLFWNLRSREGIEVGSGLYIWFVSAPSDPTDPASAPLQARGKFVIVR